MNKLLPSVPLLSALALMAFQCLGNEKHFHEISFHQDATQLQVQCSVQQPQPRLIVKVPQPFAYSQDPSVLVLRTADGETLQLDSMSSLTTLTTQVCPDKDLWAELTSLHSDPVSLEVISFRSGGSFSSVIQMSDFQTRLAQLKSCCQPYKKSGN